jgi:hypothetical protein
VIIFASDKRFWMNEIRQRGLGGNTTVGRKGKGSNTVIPTIHRTTFRGCIIVSTLFLSAEECQVRGEGKKMAEAVAI